MSLLKANLLRKGHKIITNLISRDRTEIVNSLKQIKTDQFSFESLIQTRIIRRVGRRDSKNAIRR